MKEVEEKGRRLWKGRESSSFGGNKELVSWLLVLEGNVNVSYKQLLWE